MKMSHGPEIIKRPIEKCPQGPSSVAESGWENGQPPEEAQLTGRMIEKKLRMAGMNESSRFGWNIGRGPRI